MSRLTEARAGLVAILPPLLAAVPIGTLFGAVASTHGLSPFGVLLMSAVVFAGGAQFAAIEQWASPLPWLAIVVGTGLINARHILMGASLTPKTGRFSAVQRALGFYVMADETWAMAERRAAMAPLTPAFWFGMVVPFYLNWVAWSVVGAVLGPLLGDPARVGADFAFTALFIGLVAGFWRAQRAPRSPLGAAILASAGAAALVKVVAGPPWYVPAGALAGIAAAYLAASPEEPHVAPPAAPEPVAVAEGVP